MSSLDTTAPNTDQKLAELISRINDLGNGLHDEAKTSDSGTPGKSGNEDFIPWAPTSLAEAHLTESEVEALVLKFLLAKGNATGHETANHIRLPFRLVEPLISRMKLEQVLIYRSATSTGDYVLQLADLGRERARRLAEVSTYYGAAPVTLSDYNFSVSAQSLVLQRPRMPELKKAFADLLINPTMLDRLGPAISAGKGMFLYGYPGNGKTSIAERVTKAFGATIWIPRAISVDGEIIRVYDPVVHEEVPVKDPRLLHGDRNIDHRWVRIKRPTVVVGGELTMDQLEIVFNPTTGIGEAPLQMKSNCGTLVVDDFGRQKMSTDELLNRWIVPLEKRYDFLNTLSGKKLQVPFDQLIVFSTNLEPRDLVDDAFLRRIPYKIEVKDPTEQEFRALFKIMCDKLGFTFDERAVTYLIEKHYLPTQRPFRNCQPRDLLLQIKYYCEYLDRPLELSPTAVDFAVENYFSVV